MTKHMRFNQFFRQTLQSTGLIAMALAGVVLMTASGCGGKFLSSDRETAKYIESLSKASLGTDMVTEYRVGPEDVLDVHIWGDEELSTQVTVRPDGMVSVPLVGDVMVSGLTAGQIGMLISADLKAFKTDPSVDVSIAEVNSYRIYLLGEVNQPGMVQVRNFTTLLQAIALAGGTTRFASNNVLVLRKDRGESIERVLSIDYRLLLSDRERHRPYNLVLWPGDTVIVK